MSSIELDFETDAEAVVPATWQNTGQDRHYVHAFEDCQYVRNTRTRRASMNTLFHDTALCSACERRVRDGEDPDADSGMFEELPD